MISGACGVVLVPICGALSDRFGRRPVYSVGAVLFGVWIYPAFLLLNNREPTLIWLSIVVGLGLLYPAIYAPLAAFWAELFDTRVRYTGVGSVYHVSGIFASGITPAIAATLLAIAGGTPWLFCGYVIVATIISLACMYVLPETYRRDISPTGEAVAHSVL